mgnify:CR=1 FL=1
MNEYDRWQGRYAVAEYVFGEEPNAFLKSKAGLLPKSGKALAVADGLRRLGKSDDARALLKSFGDKFSDSVVMDGLLAANAPAPKPPSAASGVSDILFDIGSILSSDPRNQRADLALIFLQLAVELKPDYAEAHNSLGVALAAAGLHLFPATPWFAILFGH